VLKEEHCHLGLLIIPQQQEIRWQGYQQGNHRRKQPVV